MVAAGYVMYGPRTLMVVATEKGVFEFTEALSGTYKYDSWIISEKGSPDVDELLQYDAVIWTTGEYWDDSLYGSPNHIDGFIEI